MRRGHNNKGFGGRLTTILSTVLAAGAGLLVLTQLDSLRRYLGIRRMSARKHPQPPGTQAEGKETMPRWGTSHWPVH